MSWCPSEPPQEKPHGERLCVNSMGRDGTIRLVIDQLASHLTEQRALLTFSTKPQMGEFVLFITCVFKLSFYVI